MSDDSVRSHDPVAAEASGRCQLAVGIAEAEPIVEGHDFASSQTEAPAHAPDRLSGDVQDADLSTRSVEAVVLRPHHRGMILVVQSETALIVGDDGALEEGVSCSPGKAAFIRMNVVPEPVCASIMSASSNPVASGSRTDEHPAIGTATR